MSVRYGVITCPACDRTWSSSMLNGQFVWRDRHGHEAHLNRELAVCHACEEVVPMERFPAVEEYEEARQVLSLGWLRRWQLRRAEKRKPWSGSLRSEAITSPKAFKVIEAVMELNRKPVCLNCGSTHVEAIAMPADYDQRDVTPRPLNRAHPTCGNLLLVRGSGDRRVAMRRKKHVYDIEGQHIETTDPNEF